MKAKELAEIYGVTPMQIGKLRKALCDAEDYNEKTRDILPHGVKKIKNYFKKKDDKIIEPQFVRVQALSPTPSPLFYYCKLLEKPVFKIRVAIPPTHRSIIRKGLVFKAQVIEKSGEKFYRHEVVYKREQERQKRLQEVYK
jgi:hypothetical protein